MNAPPSQPLTPDGLRVLEAQLSRMRAMLYRYYELFYRFTSGGLVVSGALFIGSFWPPTQVASVLLPFVIIYIGFHAAHLFSYVIFARTHAEALERRINREICWSRIGWRLFTSAHPTTREWPPRRCGGH